jgi:hypothetical protein
MFKFSFVTDILNNTKTSLNRHDTIHKHQQLLMNKYKINL